MPVLDLLLAALAGFAGGAMNALAGGGTFVTLPTLIALGLPPTIANATSAVALQPGAAMSAWSHRRSLSDVQTLSLKPMLALTFAGGLVGALLLMLTSEKHFSLIVPWLLLFATIVLAGGRRASAALARRVTIGTGTFAVIQFLLGVYGGYFGGAVGLLMAALWGLLAGTEPHQIQGHRTLMLAVANAAAAILFIAAGMIGWALCLPMLAGATAGGWIGAEFGKRLSPAFVRWMTFLVTAVTTAIFFWRAYA